MNFWQQIIKVERLLPPQQSAQTYPQILCKNGEKMTKIITPRWTAKVAHKTKLYAEKNRAKLSSEYQMSLVQRYWIRHIFDLSEELNPVTKNRDRKVK